MKKMIFLMLGLIVCFCISATSNAAQTITAQKVEKAPVVDGEGTDPVWAKAKAIITHDKVADIDVTLKTVYTDREIFFLVSFPDPDESKTHKSWVWNKAIEVYEMGPDREDIFIFKWNMEAEPVDLSIYADHPYKADIWFWKACRTNPAGFADDKTHILNNVEMKNATKLTSRKGTTMYLLRKEDEGQSAYEIELWAKYKGDVLLRFTSRTPTGSRADVKAKGIWKDRKWTIEFGRVLNTGKDDDIQFDLTKSYHFGVSRYEIAGRGPNSELTQPLYGDGDISEVITLIFGD